MVEGGCDKQKSDTQTWLCRPDDGPAGLTLVGVRNSLDPIQDVEFSADRPAMDQVNLAD